MSRYGTGSPWSEAFGGSSGSGTIAERWIETGVLSNSRPPAYPAFLALNATIFGGDAYVPVVVVLQALTAWMTMMALLFVARRATWSSAWGLCAVTLVSLNEFWVNEAVRSRETFLYSAILLALAGVTVWARPASPRSAAALGALCAFGWLTRPTGIVLFPAVLVLFWRDWRGLGAGPAVVFTLALSLPMLGWVAYQQVQFGSVSVSGDDGPTRRALRLRRSLAQPRERLQRARRVIDRRARCLPRLRG